MAGISLGAVASTLPASIPAQPRHLIRVPASSRTRLNHGVFLFGTEVAAVYSTRRATDGHGVTMTVGQNALTLTGNLTPTQARMMARALLAAADSAEKAQGVSQAYTARQLDEFLDWSGYPAEHLYRQAVGPLLAATPGADTTLQKREG